MKKDRRYLKTEKQIIDVFIQLLNEKGFNRLTVRDIADRADINRATFYQHYVDKYTLLKHCEDHWLHKAESMMQTIINVDMLTLYDHGTALPGLEEVLVHYKEHRMLILGLLEIGGTPSFRDRLTEAAQTHLNTILKSQFNGKVAYPMPYISAYLISAHFGIVLEWLKRGANEPTEEIATLITRLTLHGALHGLNLV
ncbi:TetR/AcrR family transcriptional regulator [Sporolactobacillus shoreicorticis]|uniref:TetR/AcrR family transcriptional regulator n=1 Tax=Sporolactobacillus shoreicorticis TaxID=1923877 RepID=A0ABW5S3W3_9BACL|nr:TetR/AcrR family transcriptional regulator C-terminal domain-containing protein [Sporolactobacillus shoreicorticis]MCO7124364.1 TetR/AcrR family transcriptional regulator [Sporolactobacillus shoreicorticis]